MGTQWSRTPWNSGKLSSAAVLGGGEGGVTSALGVQCGKLDKPSAIIPGSCSARSPGLDRILHSKLGNASLLNLGLLSGGDLEAGT